MEAVTAECAICGQPIVGDDWHDNGDPDTWEQYHAACCWAVECQIREADRLAFTKER